MRHLKKKITLGRKTGPRQALLRSLCISFIEKENIQTTKTKAKAIKEMIEPLVTMGRESSVHNFRQIEKVLGNKKATQKLIKEISPRFLERPGGYTSIVKVGARQGDGAEIVILRFVD